jgi:nicotinate-nucleotide adenylyltransferase
MILRKIGIFGGTFDPPHIGHLIMARRAVEQLGLDKVFFVPANIPPHKKIPVASAEHRLNMLRIALLTHPDFTISTCEIERGGISYTIDTIKFFRENISADEYFLLVGEDSALKIHTWKNSSEILNSVKVAWFPRYIPNKNEFHNFPDLKNFVKIEAEIIDVSSSRIRQLIKEGKSVKYLVPDGVLMYIERNGLYMSE